MTKPVTQKRFSVHPLLVWENLVRTAQLASNVGSSSKCLQIIENVVFSFVEMCPAKTWSDPEISQEDVPATLEGVEAQNSATAGIFEHSRLDLCSLGFSFHRFCSFKLYRISETISLGEKSLSLCKNPLILVVRLDFER